ncbi:phytanoyl-CoA dioxygenase family protein [Massilia forsythiae]|uniref:Phytanoyl-CoA dioxygenase family protein n=1 Tax=Massilia forsythiae TaxID=2728020 RepID=A0A7Z2ZUS4_9BURK|nr:phytanoyl-CoA dioxygenase family protein [Massilia forsythiae]QJE01362.1 phytanoyl-CoA dioxygenase family protein [Massilia forsythiae]
MVSILTLASRSRHARLKLLDYYLQRAVTSRRLRRAATRATIAVLHRLHGSPARATLPDPLQQAPHAAATPPALQALRERGIAPLGRLLPPAHCAEVRAWLRHRDLVAARGDGRTFRLDSAPPGVGIGDVPLGIVVDCPHIMALANHPTMLRLARDYLGYTPIITLIGLRWSFAGAAADGMVQAFHRDSEPGCIKMLVYLTDVDALSGPHSFVAGSHRDRMPLRLRRYEDDEVARTHGAAEVVTGAAGTAFAIDSKGIYKGTPPARGARLLLVVQYSLLPCLLYDYTPLPYRGGGVFDRYVNRLVIEQR